MMRTDELKQAVAKAVVIVACALLPAISSASQDSDAMKAGTTATTSVQAGSHVYVVKGYVFVTQGKKPSHRVIDNEVIVSDTLISTGDNSAALLKFEDGQIVTIQANSAFRVREYRYDAKKVENSSIIFSMIKGGMRFVTGLIGQRKKQAFRLLAQNATLGIRGTDFMVATAGNNLYSRVQSGKISLTNAAGMTVLGAGQTAIVESSGALATIVAASAIPAGTFSELLSIPLDPSAIPVPAPVPAVVPVPVPVPAPVAEPPVSVSTQAAEPPPKVSLEEPQQEAEGKGGTTLTGKVGTLGYGAELNLSISDSVKARFGINGGAYKYNAYAGSSNYDFDLQLQSVSALTDWHPYENGFRASAGLLYNNTKDTFVPAGSSFMLGGTSYSTIGTGPNVLSSYQGTMTFNSIAPYLGIGWGNAVTSDKGWGLETDIGVLFQGSPKIDLVATCATSCNTLQADAEAENAKLQNDLNKYKWWPVVSIGISYQW